MSIRARLRALEKKRKRVLPGAGLPSFQQALERFATLARWLSDHGYRDALAAVEAGESGPAQLEDLLREQAGKDAKHRAWERIENALAEGKLPDHADLAKFREK